ncbi:hypothetical protein ACB092_05G216900 [Castanea dentata]
MQCLEEIKRLSLEDMKRLDEQLEREFHRMETKIHDVENKLRLVAKHKRELEEFHNRILNLLKDIDAGCAIELEMVSIHARQAIELVIHGMELDMVRMKEDELWKH